MKEILFECDEYKIVYDFEDFWFYFEYSDGHRDRLFMARPGFFDLEVSEYESIREFIMRLVVKAYDKE